MLADHPVTKPSLTLHYSEFGYSPEISLRVFDDLADQDETWLRLNRCANKRIT